MNAKSCLYNGDHLTMKKKFNDTGLCVPHRHYMADTSKKIEQIIRLIEEGEYFTINRPRQFGKTTTERAIRCQQNQRCRLKNIE